MNGTERDVSHRASAIFDRVTRTLGLLALVSCIFRTACHQAPIPGCGDGLRIWQASVQGAKVSNQDSGWFGFIQPEM
jgi:hypothetical protein